MYMFGLFEKKKAFENLSATQFASRIREDNSTVVLDVRTSGEYSGGNIPGSVNIDLMAADFPKRINTLDKTKTYLVYCRSGSRSAQACAMMTDIGLNACNLAGGISTWPGNLQHSAKKNPPVL
jgi:rhodanese-related sulfurtransferase